MRNLIALAAACATVTALGLTASPAEAAPAAKTAPAAKAAPANEVSPGALLPSA